MKKLVALLALTVALSAPAWAAKPRNSDSSASVTTAQRVSLNRWKRRGLSARRAIMATGKYWHLLLTSK